MSTTHTITIPDDIWDLLDDMQQRYGPPGMTTADSVPYVLINGLEVSAIGADPQTKRRVRAVAERYSAQLMDRAPNRPAEFFAARRLGQQQ